MHPPAARRRPPAPLWPVIAVLAAAGTAGAWAGAASAHRTSTRRPELIVSVLLLGIGLALIAESSLPWRGAGMPGGPALQLPVAAALGLAIGVVCS